MRKFSRQEIDEIIKQSDIVDVIGQYIKVEPAGKNYRCVCPFHDDHKPSMSISPSHKLFHCFACGAKGNVANFIQRYEKIEFSEAIFKLAKINGIDVSDIDQVNFYSQQEQQLLPIYECLKAANDLFIYQLKHQLSDQALKFIQNRQLDSEIIDNFQIGFCDYNFDIYNYLISKGFSHQVIIDSNLVIEKDYGYYSFLNNRIIFPIIDRFFRIVGFSARALGDDDAKYINSSSAKHFQKSKILYNYQNCLDHNLNKEVLYVCEGVMDVLAFNKIGVKKVVASLGTAFTIDHAYLLKKMNCPICLCFDSDDAGLKATLNTGLILRKQQIKFNIINNQSGLDPDEIVRNLGNQALFDLLNNTIDWYEFIIDYAISLYGLSSFDNKIEIVNFVSKNMLIDNSLELSHVISILSNKIGFSNDDLRNELSKSVSVSKKKSSKVESKIIESNKVLLCEKQIISHLLLGKYYVDLYIMTLNGLLHPEMNILALKIIEYYKTNDTMVIATLLNSDLSQLMKDVLIEVTTSELFQFPKNDNTFRSNVEMVLSLKKKSSYNLLTSKINSNSNDQETLELLKKLLILKKS